jgi:hypothetical protein
MRFQQLYTFISFVCLEYPVLSRAYDQQGSRRQTRKKLPLLLSSESSIWGAAQNPPPTHLPIARPRSTLSDPLLVSRDHVLCIPSSELRLPRERAERAIRRRCRGARQNPRGGRDACRTDKRGRQHEARHEVLAGVRRAVLLAPARCARPGASHTPPLPTFPRLVHKLCTHPVRERRPLAPYLLTV